MADKDKKETPKVKAEVLNPFSKGVTYPELIKAMGTQSVKEYLKDVCTESEIEFIENDLLNYKNNNKK
jgi:hypothetical protein